MDGSFPNIFAEFCRLHETQTGTCRWRFLVPLRIQCRGSGKRNWNPQTDKRSGKWQTKWSITKQSKIKPEKETDSEEVQECCGHPAWISLKSIARLKNFSKLVAIKTSATSNVINNCNWIFRLWVTQLWIHSIKVYRTNSLQETWSHYRLSHNFNALKCFTLFVYFFSKLKFGKWMVPKNSLILFINPTDLKQPHVDRPHNCVDQIILALQAFKRSPFL